MHLFKVLFSKGLGRELSPFCRPAPWMPTVSGSKETNPAVRRARRWRAATYSLSLCVIKTQTRRPNVTRDTLMKPAQKRTKHEQRKLGAEQVLHILFDKATALVGSTDHFEFFRMQKPVCQKMFFLKKKQINWLRVWQINSNPSPSSKIIVTPDRTLYILYAPSCLTFMMIL